MCGVFVDEENNMFGNDGEIDEGDDEDWLYDGIIMVEEFYWSLIY